MSNISRCLRFIDMYVSQDTDFSVTFEQSRIFLWNGENSSMILYHEPKIPNSVRLQWVQTYDLRLNTDGKKCVRVRVRVRVSLPRHFSRICNTKPCVDMRCLFHQCSVVYLMFFQNDLCLRPCSLQFVVVRKNSFTRRNYCSWIIKKTRM